MNSINFTGSKYTLAVEKISETIKNCPTNIKIRALFCFANLINVERDPKKSRVDQRVTLMTREWFRSFSKQPPAIDMLFSICKNPFPEIQFGAFTFLDAVCQHHWGEELVANCAGFLYFLLSFLVIKLSSPFLPFYTSNKIHKSAFKAKLNKQMV